MTVGLLGGGILISGCISRPAESAGDGVTGITSLHDGAAPAYLDDLNEQSEPILLQLPKGRHFPLAEMIKQPVATYNSEQLAKMFPAFQHAPFEKSGFYATSLPFRYKDREGSGSDNEANAFAFLLSNAMDWAPGCYCSRHAYFAFKYSRETLEPMRTEYNHAAIARHIKEWRGTHAIGGGLTRTKIGYAGTLEIFNARGRTVLDKKYDKEQPYFELLGNMAADAMRFLGDEPSAALVSHLKMPRCEHMESIFLLGSAAFMQGKPDRQFAIYNRILDQDPGFAEVRYWLANQSFWRDRDQPKFEKQKAISLDTYLSEAPLADFEPAQCEDTALLRKYPAWLEKAEALVGKDNPTLLRRRLRENNANDRFDEALLERAIRVTGRNANRHYLLRAIGDAYVSSWKYPSDLDMAASVYFAGRQNFFTPGVGGKEAETNAFASQVGYLGRDDIAAQMMADPQNEDQLNILIPSLFSLGQFDELLRVYDENQALFHLLSKESALFAGVAAGIIGDEVSLEKIQKVHRMELSDAGYDKILHCYAAALRGEAIDLALQLPAATMHDNLASSQWDILQVQADLLNGKTAYRARFMEHQRGGSLDRMVRFLLDGYERLQPTPDGPAFYECLEWLHNDDPWVTKAVSDARMRNVPVAADEVEVVVKALSGFPVVRWPKPGTGKGGPKTSPSCWRVAAAIHQLSGDDLRKARLLAYQNYASVVDSPYLAERFFANHLIHIIDQIEH